MKLIFPWLILSLALLTGCITHKKITFSYVTTDSTPLRVTDKNAQAQLAEAAVSVGHSFQEISAIQMAVHPYLKLPPPLNPRTIGMDQQTSLDWNGPIEPLLREIAKMSSYKLRILGKRPAIPALISINSTDVPLAEILRDATYQIKNKASIIIYPHTRIIELRYYPN